MALRDALAYRSSLPPSLQADGPAPAPAAPPASGSRSRRAPAPAGPSLSARSSPIRDERALVVARRELGRALAAGDCAKTAMAATALRRFHASERMIRGLQLGKIATLLSRHNDARVAKAGEELVAYFSNLLAMQKLTK